LGGPRREGRGNSGKDEEIYITALGLGTPRQVACFAWDTLKIKEMVWLLERDIAENRKWRRRPESL
jgi:hypothetical protein